MTPKSLRIAAALTPLLTVACAISFAQAPAGKSAALPPDDTAAHNGGIADQRDPFWPVGWKPTPINADDEEDVNQPPVSKIKWEEALSRIKVTGISETFKPDVYIAIVKGFGVVEKGDLLTIKFDGMEYQVLIKDITSAGLVPEKRGVTPIK